MQCLILLEHRIHKPLVKPPIDKTCVSWDSQNWKTHDTVQETHVLAGTPKTGKRTILCRRYACV